MNLTVNQRYAIRHIAGDEHCKEAPGKRTINSLIKRGFVTEGGSLTDAGVTAHQHVMHTGNGPEYLKSLFRF